MKNLFFLFILIFLNCTKSSDSNAQLADWVGSTPADAEIKADLGIPADKIVDFIKWQLNLEFNNTFKLEVEYGKSKNNTLGFENGAEKKVFRGKYEWKKEDLNMTTRLALHSNDISLSMIKLSENAIHILNSTGDLIVGNGGYSYGLSKINKSEESDYYLITKFGSYLDQETTFDGRTPCQEISKIAGLSASSDCFKLKWRVVFQPTDLAAKGKYEIRQIINNEAVNSVGSYEIQQINGKTIFTLKSPDNIKPYYLWKVSDKVFYFVDENQKLLTGNSDFCYALNKKV